LIAASHFALGGFRSGLALGDLVAIPGYVCGGPGSRGNTPSPGDGWGPGGYKWRQWDHLKEERRRTEIESRGRASVADLYD
jgi:hypothetical protein